MSRRVTESVYSLKYEQHYIPTVNNSFFFFYYYFSVNALSSYAFMYACTYICMYVCMYVFEAVLTGTIYIYFVQNMKQYQNFYLNSFSFWL